MPPTDYGVFQARKCARLFQIYAACPWRDIAVNFGRQHRMVGVIFRARKTMFKNLIDPMPCDDFNYRLLQSNVRPADFKFLEIGTFQ